LVVLARVLDLFPQLGQSSWFTAVGFLSTLLGLYEFINRNKAMDKPQTDIPRQIPSPPMDFTGREGEMKYLLTQFTRGATITCLLGMPGIGKTALAYKLAQELKDRYPDGQILVELEGTTEKPLTPAEAMGKVIRAYDLQASLQDDYAELSKQYRQKLYGKHALLLLDNAADGKQVLPLLQLPSNGCAVIITSRKKFSVPGMPNPFPLDTLKPSEARNLLMKICPRIDGQADELANLCGYLPLALRASASLLAVKSNQNVETYLEELHSERTRLKMIGNEGVDLDVEASFNLSYRRLTPEMASVFCRLSIFPSDFDATAEEAICQDLGHAHLSDLVIWSLVDFIPTSAKNKGYRYHLHDMARIFADSHLEAAAKTEAQQRHAGYYQKLLWSANELYYQGGEALLSGLRLFDVERSNILQGQKWSEINSVNDRKNATICSNFAISGSILHLRLHPRAYIEWLEAALVAARQINDNKAEGDHLCNLGVAYRVLGEFDRAIDHSKRSIDIARTSKEQKLEGKALVELGNEYFAIDEYDQALVYYEDALKVAKDIVDRRIEGGALREIGITYRNLGEARKSIIYQKQNLRIAQDLGDSVNEGIALGNLGRAYINLGQNRRGMECHERQLVITRNIGDRLGEGRALTNLGYAYTVLKEIPKAIEYNNKALKILRELGDVLWESNALRNLGFAYNASGDAPKAIEYLKQSLAISTRMAVKDRRGKGDALGYLGNAYAKLGENKKAIELYEQQLAITQNIKDKRGEGNALWNMSQSQDKLGLRKEAIASAQSAAEIFEKIESPNARSVRQALAEWQK
jgi:tetratricopeptide (TPR) repeat protein